MEVARPAGRIALVLLALAGFGAAACAQGTPVRPEPSAETDLRAGIAFTSRGEFDQAIPRFLAARGRVADAFALEFNLALCYVGTRRFRDAIPILSAIPRGARAADVQNLLTQALVGDRQVDAAWKAFQQAASLAPQNEKLYLLVAQACLDEGFGELAGQVLETGLRNLPGSARLHFQRGIFYAQQDDNQQAAREFQRAQASAPGSEIASIAAAEQALIEGRIQDCIRSARSGIEAGHSHYLLLTLLGEALLRAGATPATPAEFREARAALEKAVAVQPGYFSSHVALGRVYLALGRKDEGIGQLETGRRLDPRNKAVYPPLAAAYRSAGQPKKAREALAALAELNREDASRTGAANGGRAGYVSGKPTGDKMPQR